MSDHPLKSHNPDDGCRWLCLTAGIRSASDEAILAEVLETLPHQGRALILPPMPHMEVE